VGVGEWCRNVFIKDTIETYLAERRKCPEEFKRGEDKEKKKKIVPFIDSLVIRFKKGRKMVGAHSQSEGVDPLH
jgi:hypothetical protein